MTTAQYVSWLSKRVAGNLYSRQDLVDAINMAQNEILGRDIKYMRCNPDAYLHSTVDVYSYAASTYLFSGVNNTTQYDIRDVKRVYTYNIRNSNIFAYGGLNRTSHRPDLEVNNYASDEVEISCDVVPSILPNAADCTINLWADNNPATSTTVYRVVAYKWPTQITSESVAISIPEQFQRFLLKYAIFRDLEYTDFGSADKPDVLYAAELKKFDLWANGIKNSASQATPPREV